MELRTLLPAGARLAATIAFGLGILLASPDGHAQSDKLKAAFEKDLKESGLSYQKTPDEKLLIYVTSVVRKEDKVDVQVILADSNTVVFQTRIAAKGALKITPDLIESLLMENVNADFVKLGFTPSEDLIVRYDVRLTAIDGDEVKFLVEMVADFSIGLVGRLKASNFVK